MTQPIDPIQILREHDPYPTPPVRPEVAARLWARIEPRLDDAPRTSLLRSWLMPATGIAAAAAVVAIAVGMGLGRPTPTGPSVPIGDVQTGSCLEAYSPETLPHRQLAFDGTVTGIEPAAEVDVGFDVTFNVNVVYIGDPDDTVTITFPATTSGDAAAAGPAGGGAADDGAADGASAPVSIGDRLLVSGDQGAAWTCGFTRTWSSEMAAEWESATR